MENENLKPVKELTPFTKMIMTIGTLPTSFYASMSYYESMVWLYEYLKNEVIPTVNNNAEAVEELQEKFTELKTWIDEYFDNLDLQEEINKKLDEMALDGTLTNLIKDYVDPIYGAYEESINGEITLFKRQTNEKLDNQDLEISSFKTSVNSQIDYIENKVDSAVSGTPKGVYATVAALELADPDHDYIYVVSADGKWYYYNTSLTSWTAGGTYQSSVNLTSVNSLVNEIQCLDNLFNEESLLYNKYIASDGRNENSPAGELSYKAIVANYLIPVTPESKFSFILSFKNVDYSEITPWQAVGQYSDSDTFISRLTNNGTHIKIGDTDYVYGSFTLGDSTTFIKFSCRTFGKANIRLIYGEINNIISHYYSNKDYNKTTRNFIETNNIDLNFESGSLNESGNPVSDDTRLRSTDFIRVTKNDIIGIKEKYTKERAYKFAIKYYTLDKTVTDDSGWKHEPIIIDNDYYIKILLAYDRNTSIEESDLPTFNDLIYSRIKRDYSNDINNLKVKNNKIFRSIAHRGLSEIYPENTMLAFKEAIKYGFEYIETDVRFTSDGVAVLLHDQTINRTGRNADGTTISQTINIEDITYAEALEYDFGIYKGDDFAGEKIPTLENFLKLCKYTGTKPYIECKTSLYGHDTYFFGIFNKLHFLEDLTFISSGTVTLDRIKNWNPKARIGCIYNISTSIIQDLIALKTSQNDVFVDTDTYEDISSDILDQYYINNIGIEVYGADTIAEIKALPEYINGATCNYYIANNILYDYYLN